MELKAGVSQVLKMGRMRAHEGVSSDLQHKPELIATVQRNRGIINVLRYVISCWSCQESHAIISRANRTQAMIFEDHEDGHRYF